MKQINQFINEYIIKKKLDKPIDSENYFEYHPKTKQELFDNINELVENNIYDFNCIDTNKITDMSMLFEVCKEISNIDFDVSKWDVSNVEIFIGMFNYCSNIYDIDFSNWDISNGKYLNSMFFECKKFKGNGLENWSVCKVKDMSSMFYNCTNFNCDLSNWDISKVYRRVGTFHNCTSLKNKPIWYQE